MLTDQTLESFRGFFFIQTLLETLRQPLDRESVQKLEHLPLWQEHELAQALFALQCKSAGLPVPALQLDQNQSGAIPLFCRGGFPWRALPYPKEHAELGRALSLLGYEESARKVAQWQKNTLDHRGRPIHSLFLQEGGCGYPELEAANRQLFEAVGEELCLDETITDSDFGLLGKRTEESTILSVASGCKSGMGVFLCQDGGIVNYGPQLLPVGECSGFGIAGLPQNLKLTDETLSYRTRVAAPNARQTGFSHLKDTGYSGFWLEVDQKITPDMLQTKLALVGSNELDKVALTFFGRGDACYVAKSHKLIPRSLNRYQGPAQPITLGDKVTLDLQEGASKMEIIPLAGDDSFWGADFLIAFTLTGLPVNFSLAFMK
ncbi:MAG: hypothetical protein KR126chlam2_00443 [Chlamydiae bacterium]|nr:hypothetical protein [Chlamydiota bacterium]